MQMKKFFGPAALTFTLIMGALGFYLRRLQLQTSFEIGTGLAVRGSKYSLAVLVFLLAAGILALGLSLAPGMRRMLPKAPARALRCGPLASAVSVFCAFSSLWAGAILFLSSRSWPLAILYTVLAAMTLLSFLQGPTAAFRLRSGAPDALSGFAFAAPLAADLFWLILLYRNHSGNPVLWVYAIQILSVAAFILAHYYLAGYVFGKPSPVRSLFFTILAAILGLTNLADTGPGGLGALTVSNTLTMLFFAAVIAGNAFTADHN